MRRGAKPVIRIFRVIVHAVCGDSIDLANRNVIIEKIRIKNTALIIRLKLNSLVGFLVWP